MALRRAEAAAAVRPPKSLIVTADDFGLSPEVNEAVEVAHRRGILTGASLMVNAPAAADAVRRAKRLPSLRVGLHLVLVEGRPTLPAGQVPGLVDAEGRFRTDMARLGAAIFFRPEMRRQLAAEIEAQFDAFAATGLTLDHVNAHKHFHVHPTIAGTLIDIGGRHRLHGVRAPSEPRSVLAQIEPSSSSLPVATALLGTFGSLLQRRLRGAGLYCPDHVFGAAWSGAMTHDRLVGLLQYLPDGCSEIYLHPATNDCFDGAAPGYQYREELAALTAPATLDALQRSGAVLGAFSDFAAP